MGKMSEREEFHSIIERSGLQLEPAEEALRKKKLGDLIIKKQL
jgi:hypothetical protein